MQRTIHWADVSLLQILNLVKEINAEIYTVYDLVKVPMGWDIAPL